MQENYWKIALNEARKAYDKGEVPVGCVIVKNNKIIAKAHNQKEQKADCLAHAELLAIKKAQKKCQDWRLNDCDIYITLEPCVMCAGAILHARFKNVYYAASDSKWGAQSKLRLFSEKHFNHKINHVFIPQQEAIDYLQDFFKNLRKQKR